MKLNLFVLVNSLTRGLGAEVFSGCGHLLLLWPSVPQFVQVITTPVLLSLFVFLGLPYMDLFFSSSLASQAFSLPEGVSLDNPQLVATSSHHLKVTTMKQSSQNVEASKRMRYNVAQACTQGIPVISQPLHVHVLTLTSTINLSP